MDLTGKTVLITGASRGIGEAAAHAFASAGANVALAARSSDAIAALAEEIGSAAIAIPCDVTRYTQVEAAVATTIAAFGRLDILVGNAGVIDPISHLSSADPEGWGTAIDINLKGVFHGMRAAMPIMMSQGSGTILTVGSGAAYNPLEGWSHYCASKAGALMLTHCAHLEGAAHGLRVMSLSPGTVATQMQHEIKASGVNPISQLDWSDHIPPDWPARALVWMCTAQADAHLGQEISLRDPEMRRQVGLA
ncbi:SDR family oxidoreductase [Roseovarius sp.]|jgi:NAD(P)-dependent dehydrogenase (short-subunit alcohol dehydrogenase family)